MFDELAVLYTAQRRHLDLFNLYVRRGWFESALNVPFDDDSSAKIPEQQVLMMMDYIWVCHYTSITKTVPAMANGGFVIHKSLKTANVMHRNRQWEAVGSLHTLQSSQSRSPGHARGIIEDPTLKQFVNFRVSRISQQLLNIC